MSPDQGQTIAVPWGFWRWFREARRLGWRLDDALIGAWRNRSSSSMLRALRRSRRERLRRIQQR